MTVLIECLFYLCILFFPNNQALGAGHKVWVGMHWSIHTLGYIINFNTWVKSYVRLPLVNAIVAIVGPDTCFIRVFDRSIVVYL